MGLIQSRDSRPLLLWKRKRDRSNVQKMPRYFFPKLQIYSETIIFNRTVRPYTIQSQCGNISLEGFRVFGWAGVDPFHGQHGIRIWRLATTFNGTRQGYHLSPASRDHIWAKRQKIRNAIQSIDGNILRKAYKNMEIRLSFIVREQWGHLEHLINSLKLMPLCFYLH